MDRVVRIAVQANVSQTITVGSVLILAESDGQCEAGQV